MTPARYTAALDAALAEIEERPWLRSGHRAGAEELKLYAAVAYAAGAYQAAVPSSDGAALCGDIVEHIERVALTPTVAAELRARLRAL